jgi:hypothetical protein
MALRPYAWWLVFLRGLIAILLGILLLALFLARYPPALRGLILFLHPPGVVDIPELAPTPLPPLISLPQGEIPAGYLALSAASDAGIFGCNFLLELDDGRRVGVGAAHATPLLAPDTPVEFYTPAKALAARSQGQLARGSPFIRSEFRTDFVLWQVAEIREPGRLLKPDPRGQPEPGELVLVFGRSADGAGGSIRRPGVVMSAAAQAIWIQLDDSFDPRGYSGCPVVSRYTGRLIGMAVAGEDKHPVVMGLHPVGSLVEKAAAAFSVP